MKCGKEVRSNSESQKLSIAGPDHRGRVTGGDFRGKDIGNTDKEGDVHETYYLEPAARKEGGGLKSAAMAYH